VAFLFELGCPHNEDIFKLRGIKVLDEGDELLHLWLIIVLRLNLHEEILRDVLAVGFSRVF